MGKITLSSGFSFDGDAAAAHVMQPDHTRGVRSSRGLEEGKTAFAPRAKPAGPATLDVDGFVAAVNAALALNTAGYVMQLRQHGQPIASAQVDWAKRPTDGGEAWDQPVRMHIASCSKLITAIAMTRALAQAGLPATTKISTYLPSYWSRGPNIDQITFAELMTHTSGFRVPGSDMSFPTMKSLIAGGVDAANIGVYSYQNTNFGICRILLPVLTGAVPASATFASNMDQNWDFATITAYVDYVTKYLFEPAGVSGPTLTHPSNDALAYAFPPAAGWNSGDMTTESGGAGWHMSVDDLLDILGCFRRAGTIMSATAAQAMLDNSFGIDLIQPTSIGTLYNKNGLWESGVPQIEQSLAYFLPNDMELVVLANSPIGAANSFFRDVITEIYLDNIEPVFAPGKWIARHGLTAEQYQEAFNDYVGNQGMQLIDVSGYGSTQPLYAALWTKSTSEPAFEARHGLTAAEYQATFDLLTKQGYAPELVDGYATAAGARFACIFERGSSSKYVAKHGMTAQDYQTAFDQQIAAGYLLDWVSGYLDSGTVRYAAIWRQEAGAPEWQARHGLTAAAYQAYFDSVTKLGYKPIVVCGYSDGSQALYAAIFRQLPSAPAWQARHGLTAAQYQTTFDQLVAQGYRLELVNGYTVGNEDLFTAIWTK